MAVTTEDRFRGCLLGLAVGDAVGTTVEFKPRGSFEPVTGMVGGGPFGLKPGQWTDDTSMALCLAESLIEKRGFDARNQMELYVCWYRQGHLSSTGRCFDIGNATSSALHRFERTGIPDAHERNDGPHNDPFIGRFQLLQEMVDSILADLAQRHGGTVPRVDVVVIQRSNERCDGPFVLHTTERLCSVLTDLIVVVSERFDQRFHGLVVTDPSKGQDSCVTFVLVTVRKNTDERFDSVLPDLAQSQRGPVPGVHVLVTEQVGEGFDRFDAPKITQCERCELSDGLIFITEGFNKGTYRVLTDRGERVLTTIMVVDEDIPDTSVEHSFH